MRMNPHCLVETELQWLAPGIVDDLSSSESSTVAALSSARSIAYTCLLMRCRTKICRARPTSSAEPAGVHGMKIPVSQAIGLRHLPLNPTTRCIDRKRSQGATGAVKLKEGAPRLKLRGVIIDTAVFVLSYSDAFSGRIPRNRCF